MYGFYLFSSATHTEHMHLEHFLLHMVGCSFAAYTHCTKTPFHVLSNHALPHTASSDSSFPNSNVFQAPWLLARLFINTTSAMNSYII